MFKHALPVAIICCASIGLTPSAATAQEEIKSFGRRIVGGEATTIDKHPWQVALNIRQPEGVFLCGGSIVAFKWVVTAAHCFKPATPPGNATVKAGATFYRTEGVWTEVKTIVVHESYNGTTHDNDIAMLKLKSAPNGKIIPMADAASTLPVGEPLVVAGWGRTSEGGNLPGGLLQATVPYVAPAACNAPEAYNGAIHAGMLCAGQRDGGVDSCQGDSGGPLVRNTADGPVLVGVVSFGEGCARKLRYGIYTRVSAYRDWIAKAVVSDPN